MNKKSREWLLHYLQDNKDVEFLGKIETYDMSRVMEFALKGIDPELRKSYVVSEIDIDDSIDTTDSSFIYGVGQVEWNQGQLQFSLEKVFIWSRKILKSDKWLEWNEHEISE